MNAEVRVVVDADSDVAPYEQVRRQVREHVDSGRLAPGDRLPPVRVLAAEIGIAANTVARAYTELERDGLLVGRGRAGTFVADDDGRAARRAAREFVTRVRTLGVGEDEAVALVRSAYGA
ncbi:GntR family transcriptional regulator [Thalassiella azotivora]